jgi:uncharacterized protein YcfL
MLTVLCLALPACETSKAPGAGYGDPYPPPGNDPQITVIPEELRPWLGFQPATIVKDGLRPMQVQVPVRNLSETMYLLDYRILFYDARGMEIEPVMGWTQLALRPKQTLRISARALDLDAETYRLEIKWAR